MLHTTLVPIDLESSGEFIFIRYHDFCNMGGERLTLQVEQTIRTLSKEGNSYSVIVKKLKAEGLDVGKATICRVVNGIGKKREAESNGQKFQVDRPRPVRTPATVSKVKRLATTENPPSQRQLSRMCGTSLKTINNIIHKDLELDTRRKGKVHKLTPFHMKNRATNARKLYEEHLAGSRSEYTAKLDEAWMYVTYCNGIRKICYIKRGNQVPDNWVHQCSETFPKGFMVVGVMTGRGVLPLIKVPSKVKVNSEFYIECVLKPVIEQLKDLYPGKMDKVFLHHDKASSHTSNKTQQFLQEMKDTLGLNFIRNSDIPVKSPDASPLDFYGFGFIISPKKSEVFSLKCKELFFFGALTMSTFLPTKHNLREALLFCFNLKKSATDGHRFLCEAYGKHALSIKSCEYWFRGFKSGDFDTRDKERGGRPIKFEDAELEALLDEDSSQTQEELAETLGVTQQAISNRLKVMGMVQKQGNWVPYELKPGNIERRICTCELLLKRQNRKGFLHRIVTGDEKWIHYDNPKRRKSWVKPGHASTSTAKPNIHGKKLMLCIWWDQLGVIYYELLQPNETITGERYQQQLMRLSRALKIKRPLYAKRHDKVIYQHDNARPHVAKVVKETLEALQWDVLPHPLYSPDIASSDYHMFRSMTHGLAEQHFTSYTQDCLPCTQTCPAPSCKETSSQTDPIKPATPAPAALPAKKPASTLPAPAPTKRKQSEAPNPPAKRTNLNGPSKPAPSRVSKPAAAQVILHGEKSAVHTVVISDDPQARPREMLKAVRAAHTLPQGVWASLHTKGKLVLHSSNPDTIPEVTTSLASKLNGMKVRQQKEILPRICLFKVDEETSNSTIDETFLETAAVRKLPGDKVVRVAHCSAPRSGTCTAFIEVDLKTFRALGVRGRIVVDGVILNFEESIRARVCFRCCGFGHNSAQCSRAPKCFHCGQDGHEGLACPSIADQRTSKCANCCSKGLTDKHEARASSCPIL
ncbi:SETMAR, partial [Cordylochernes scorpioides]